MRAAIARGLLTATFAATAAIAACSYSPNFESGTLMCGPQSSCPENYHCMANYCHRDGEGGSGGGGGTSGASAKFIGRWNFVAPAERMRVCPGVNETVPLPVDANDFITIRAGSASPLLAHYYCDWNVDLNATGTATALRAGQSCTLVDTAQVPPVTFTWTGESFTLTTSNGTSGTIEASIPYAYTSTAGSGSCTATFTGPVMKQ